MHGKIQPRPTSRSRRPRLLALATLVSGVLVAGCGGSSGTPMVGKQGGATNTAAGTAGSPPGQTQIHQSELNFAKCMRANGVPNFPDPSPGGNFQVGAAGLNPAAPAVEAARAKCQKFLPSGGGPLSPGPPPSAQTMALLRRIAVCMRQHGVPQFPDPRTSAPPGTSLGEYREITNYMGAILLYPAAIDPQSPAYEHATAACGAGFLAGNNAH